MKNKRHTGRGEMLIGLLLLAAALLLTGYNLWDSRRAGQSADEILQELVLPPVLQEAATASQWFLPSAAAATELREMPTQLINGLRCIGVLEVPKVQLVLPVICDWDYEKLELAPCVYTGSYYTNDLVICGHNYSTHFSPLKDIPLGEDIYFTSVEGYVYHYTVDNLETVQPTAVEQMVSEGDWDLTLFTCHTGGQTRCAVRCVRVLE